MCCILRTTLAALLAGTVALHAAQPLYKIDTIAGTNSTGDGKPAAAAIMVQPQAVAVTSMGAVFISDSLDHRVRRIGADGIIQTWAGTGIAGRAGDGGPATKAQLNAPYGIALDPAGSLYIADLGNAVVRKVSIDGTMTTFAGGGKDAPPATGTARATQVRLVQPRDVTVDRIGNVLIADFGANQVYSVDQNGMLSVVPATGLSFPSAVTVDVTGALYIADSGNKRVRVVRYSQMTTLSDTLGHELEFGTITGIAVDSSGTVYVADGTTSRITVVKPGGDFSTLPLGGTSIYATPWGELFIVGDRQVRKYTSTSTTIVIGSPLANVAGDGKIPSEWRFSSPSSIARDASGSLWIADTGLSRVRRLTSTGELSTYSTDFDSPVSVTTDSAGRTLLGIRRQQRRRIPDRIRIAATADRNSKRTRNDSSSSGVRAGRKSLYRGLSQQRYPPCRARWQYDDSCGRRCINRRWHRSCVEVGLALGYCSRLRRYRLVLRGGRRPYSQAAR